MGNRRRNQRRIANRRQGHKPHIPVELARAVVRDGDGEARLANATRTGQRQQANVAEAQETSDLQGLVLTPDKRRERARELGMARMLVVSHWFPEAPVNCRAGAGCTAVVPYPEMPC